MLVAHDPGCKWARATAVDIDSDGKVLSATIGAGHTDAAKRASDWFNLHKAAGQRNGWIALALGDGASDGDVYLTRAEAVRFQYPNERWFFYCTLAAAPSMTVCAAESLLRYKRIMNDVEGPHTDRDAKHGGLEVIPRLALEDQEAQIQAIRTGRGAIALGYRR